MSEEQIVTVVLARHKRKKSYMSSVYRSEESVRGGNGLRYWLKKCGIKVKDSDLVYPDVLGERVMYFSRDGQSKVAVFKRIDYLNFVDFSFEYEVDDPDFLKEEIEESEWK